MTLSAQVNFSLFIPIVGFLLSLFCVRPSHFHRDRAAFTSPWRPSHTDGPSSFSISLNCDHFLFCAPPSLIFLEIVCFINSFDSTFLVMIVFSLYPKRSTLSLLTKPGTNVGSWNIIELLILFLEWFSPQKTDSLIKVFFIV